MQRLVKRNALFTATSLCRWSSSKGLDAASFPFASTSAQAADKPPFGEGTSLARSTILPPTDFPETSFLKCIQKEIDDEELRLDKECPPLPKGWEISHEEGSSFWTMHRTWTSPTGAIEVHDVRVQLTSRDASLDPECDIRGEHVPFTILIKREDCNKIIDLGCDVVEGELVVDNIRTHDADWLVSSGSVTAAIDRSLRYPGPNLDEAEEELLDGLQTWMAERQFDDQFGEFLGHYSIWIEQMEYEKWLQQLKSFVAA